MGIGNHQFQAKTMTKIMITWEDSNVLIYIQYKLTLVLSYMFIITAWKVLAAHSSVSCTVL